MTRLLSYYTIQTPWTLAYMLQQFEYSSAKFLKWLLGFPSLLAVQKRGKLDLTARAKLVVLTAYFSWAIAFMIISFFALWLVNYWLFLGLLFLPLICAATVMLFNSILQLLVVGPTANTKIKTAKAKLLENKAVRIAVLGSYGKTSMKELLVTVLSEGKKVAATPGNKNVLISHAGWANSKLTGDEEVLIFEYGEGEPGDIAKLASFSSPDMAIVTGLAPAHLDKYNSLEAVAADFADIQKYVAEDKLYAQSSPLLKEKILGKYYDQNGTTNWKASNVELDFSGTKFTLTNKKEKLQLQTGLLGAHHVGPLAVVVEIARTLGLTNKQIQAGVAAAQPYEHRMQPRHLHGAWIIDDTYNGNIEGMRAGLELLKTLSGKRKIYVTPGLVDQGNETKRVHEELGSLIAAAQPDKVVLMKNSATKHIQSGLESHGFKGELDIEENPLEYYTNLEHFLASGDVVMLQNDWPDSYK